MAKQVAVSGILAKIGPRMAQAWEKNKGNEVELGNVELPPGIRGGVAQVMDIGFGIFKTGKQQGKPYFMASARVLAPAKFKDADGRVHRIRNQHTRTSPEPLCDTPDRQGRKTLEEHVGHMINILKICGVATETLNLAQVEQVCKAMTAKGSPPLYIKFDTFAMKDEETGLLGQTNHKWLCPADASEIEAEEGEEVDEDAVQHSPGTNGVAAPPKRTGPVQRSKAPAVAAATEEAPDTEEGFTDQGDLDSLAALADNDDEDAKDRLSEMAEAQGYTEDQIRTAPSWTTLVESMKAGDDPTTVEWATEEGEEASQEEDDGTPKVGNVYKFFAIDPKTKKRSKEATEIEVTAVSEEKQTVSAKSTSDSKLKYTGIKWSALQSADE